MTKISNVALWRPDQTRIDSAEITRFTHWLNETRQLGLGDYESLWRWSVSDIEGFWQACWDWFGIQSETPIKSVLAERQMPGAKWFEGATLNYAQHLLATAREPASASRDALIFKNEKNASTSISWQTLNDQVGSVMRELRQLGVKPGDRVVSYMPNIPQTVVAMLATTGIGAIWSSCAPDMGATGVLDRFVQIEPTILFAVDGYGYSGKPHDRTDTVADMVNKLPSLKALVIVPYLSSAASADTPSLSTIVLACEAHQPAITMQAWEHLVAVPAAPVFEAMPFDAPLWIVYSSGTTGMPKPIVHGHGGSLLEGLKANSMHLDISEKDRFFWFSSTSWIMWNLWVSVLARGATILQFDGNPGYPDLNTLWAFASNERASFFGISPAFMGLNIKAGLRPGDTHDLSAVRTIGSTGSPLTPQAYEWVYDAVKVDVLLASISGGTDPGAAFLTSSPTLPVYSGQMQCRGLGCAVAAFSDEGESLIGAVGELVVTEPMPSMPLFFWGDEDGQRYKSSYFETWPNAWQHGDWLALYEQPESVTSIVYGRSDSTINRHGIRMGSSELYRVVDSFEWVLDSLVIDLEYLGRPSELLLFVVVRDAPETIGQRLSAERTSAIKDAISSGLSARHVPDQMWQIAEVPLTMSGKKLEVPVKRILLGHSAEKVLNRASMANAQAIDWFVDHAASRNAQA